MSLKTVIAQSEFQKLQEKHPNVDLMKVFTPIPDEELERRKKWKEEHAEEFRRLFNGE